MSDDTELENFWAELLSEEPERIERVWQTLDAEARVAIARHLRRMATEPDWHPLQRQSATAALNVIDG